MKQKEEKSNLSFWFAILAIAVVLGHINSIYLNQKINKISKMKSNNITVQIHVPANKEAVESLDIDYEKLKEDVKKAISIKDNRR